MTDKDKMSEFFDRLGTSAAIVQKRLNWFLGLGLLATFYLAFKLYSSDSAIWWNVVKCSTVSLPALILGVFWYCLGQVSEAPRLVNQLAADKEGIVDDIQSFRLEQNSGLRGVLRTLNQFRQYEGLSVMMETIGGITLLINPVFLLLTLVAVIGLLVLILLLPFLLIF